jgi:hypothetical protein
MSTIPRRLFARPSRLLIGIGLFVTSALISVTYLINRQPHLLPRPWAYDSAGDWEWGGFTDDRGGPEELKGPLPDDGDVEWIEGGAETTRSQDMTCHEAVERGMRVALYDYTPFHEGE